MVACIYNSNYERITDQGQSQAKLWDPICKITKAKKDLGYDSSRTAPA
jgi:hypothetical protein